MRLASVQRLSKFPSEDNPPVVRKRPNSEGFESAPYRDVVEGDDNPGANEYAVAMRVLVKHWLPTLSHAAAFKICMLFTDRAYGDDQQNFMIEMSLSEIAEAIGMHTQAVVAGLRELEGKRLIAAQRSHRRATTFELRPSILLASENHSQQSALASENHWQEVLASENHSQKGKVESENHSLRSKLVSENHWQADLVSENHWQTKSFESENHFQEAYVASENHSQHIRNIKQQQAAAFLSEEEKAELQKISARAKEQIDGKEALQLKQHLEQAGYTLTHLRWFLRNEKFERAKSRKAVLFAIAKGFHERAEGIRWPATFDESQEFFPEEKTGDQIR